MSDERTDIRLFNGPLDAAAAIAFVTSPDAGGIDVFIGTTRSETHPQAGALTHLDYHAYDEMALKELHKLVRRAREQWPLHGIALWHRLGPVAVGEASVVIAVSCPHRADAFAACRFLIDTLKETVPIWKKEVYAGGEQWQAGAVKAQGQ
jgi:molybdopterin synthase catalytic subunit